MKKNIVFIGETVIIFLLLLVISILLKERSVSTDIVLGEKGIVEETASAEGTVEETPTNNSDSFLDGEKVAQDNLKEDIKEEELWGKDLKIAVFGDSIWNADRGTTGISEQVTELTGATIYNCAIGGTTAAVVGDSTLWEEWTSRSFNGMVYIANGVIGADKLIPNDAAFEVINQVDFSNLDYLIVSYGLNDYFSDVPIYPQEYYDLTSYVGALRNGITKLKENYPDLKIIVASPTYCGWFEGERQFTLTSYVENARGVAEEMGVYFLDMYHALGKEPEQKVQYLEDGVHLNLEGRKLYAENVAKYLKQLETQE